MKKFFQVLGIVTLLLVGLYYIEECSGTKDQSEAVEDVKVAVGDVVSTGTEIGTVGNTSGIFTSKLCGDVLNVQVEDVNGKDVDPSAYFIAK